MLLTWINVVGVIIAGIACLVSIIAAYLDGLENTVHQISVIIGATVIIIVPCIDLIYFMLAGSI